MQIRILLLLASLLLIGIGTYADEPSDSVYEQQALTQLMNLLNLTPGDISFRDDYTEIDSFRVAAVAELMADPYSMISYGESWKKRVEHDDLSSLLNQAYRDIRRASGDKNNFYIKIDNDFDLSGMNTYYNSLELNRLLMRVNSSLYKIIPKAVDSTFALISRDERDFLVDQFMQIILEDTGTVNLPIEVIDSIGEIEEEYIKKFVKFGVNIRKEFILAAGIRVAEGTLDEINRLLDEVKAGTVSLQDVLGATAEIPDRVNRSQYLGLNPRWKIGGVGNDHYTGNYDFILDLGGDDFYELSYDPLKNGAMIIIDLGGNDIYNAVTDFALGSGCRSVGLLFDMAGDDYYNGANFSGGSGYFGLGLLYDGGGSDHYSGDTHCQGAGTFGIGLLYDADGIDNYQASLYAQGFGYTEGFGMIIEKSGNDNYFAGGKYPEGLGLAGDDTHYLSLSQGFAIGPRPYMSGGIGAIIELGGKDNYVSDIYGQGASYWWSMGLLYDVSGYDQYVSHQYAQGTGVHMSLGLLLDERGNDFYRGKGLMQGVGHDYACGIILDREGDDIYQADDLSQAAGSANGIGILIDNRGQDAYYILGDHNTHGYGNPRRDFGSIGLFLDLSGEDRYSGPGKNNELWKSDSKWGGGFDWEFIVEDSTGAE